jgi:hypothetical protein
MDVAVQIARGLHAGRLATLRDGAFASRPIRLDEAPRRHRRRPRLQDHRAVAMNLALVSLMMEILGLTLGTDTRSTIGGVKRWRR